MRLLEMDPTNDRIKSKEQLLAELQDARARISELEAKPAQGPRTGPRPAVEKPVPPPRDRENRLEEAQRIARIGSFERNLVTEEAWWSKETYRLFGYAPGEVAPSYDLFHRHVHPEDQQRVTDAMDSALSGEATFDFRCRYLNADGELRHAHLRGYVERDESGNPRSYHGTIQDVTGRQRAEEALANSERKYRTLVENAADSFFMCDLEGRILEVNQRACEELGYTREEMLEMTVEDVSPRVEREERQARWNRFRPGDRYSLETTHRRKNGSEFPVEIHGGVFHCGGEVRVLGLVRNISERKRAEENLIKYRNVVSSTSDGIAFLDEEYRYVIVNSAYEKFSGMRAERLTGMTVPEYLGEEVFKEVVKPNFDRCLRGETINYQAWFEYPVLGKRFVDVTYFPYRDRAGRIAGVVSNTRDITGRKRAEEALREGEARIYAVFDAVDSIPVQGYDRHRRVIFWNRASERLYGYTREEALGRKLEDLIIPPAMREEMIEGVRAWHEEGVPIPAGELTLQNREGDPVPVYSSHVIITNHDGEKEMFCIDVDLSERRQAEEALRESEELFRKSFDTELVAIAISRRSDGMYLQANPGFAKITGYKREEIIGRTSRELNFFSESQRRELMESLDKFERSQNRELAFPTGSGEWRTILFSIGPIMLGHEECLLATMVDITERKRAEEALRESENVYRAIFENAPLGLFRSAPEGRFIEVNPALAKLLGFDSAEDVLREIHNIGEQIYVHSEDRRSVVEQQLGSLGMTRHANRYRRRDGSEFIANLYLNTIRDDAGHPRYFVGIVEDVTERTRAEEALRESEERFRQVVENMATGVAVYEAVNDGEDFIFRDINASGARIGKLRREDHIGRSVWEIYPGIKDMGLMDVFRRVYRTGKPEKTPVIIYSDERIHAWTENYVFRLPSGYIVAVYDDVTERKWAEEKIRRSLREKEVLLSEVHHRVKNNMQVIASMLNLQGRRSGDPKLMEAFEDPKRRIQSMALVHETLYGSKDLSSVDLKEYVSRLVATIARSQSLVTSSVKIEQEVQSVVFDMESAVPCGLVLNELISNSLKHGFEPGEPGLVRIRIERTVEGWVDLTVEDNGKGLPEGFDLREQQSLGLILVVGLAEEQLGGRVEVESDGGTRFRVLFPLRQVDSRIGGMGEA